MKVAPTMVKMIYSWKKLTSITPSQDVSNASMIFQTYMTGRDYHSFYIKFPHPL